METAMNTTPPAPAPQQGAAKKMPPVRRPNGRPVIEPNEDYLALARKLRLAKLIVWLALLIFVVGMLGARRSELTVENFQYLTRFLQNETSVYSYAAGSRTITFDQTPELDAAVYRGDIVIAGSASLNIFTTGGNSVLDASTFLTKPVIRTSAGRMLVYDLGGYSFAVYNSFSKLHGETFSYPIYAGDIADNNRFAIVTRSQDYRSVVQLYDENFTLCAKISKEKLVTGVQFNDSGDQLLISSIYAGSSGDCVSEIMLYSVGNEEALHTVNLENCFAVRAFYTPHGFAVLTDSSLLFYNQNAELLTCFPFNGETPSCYEAADERIFISFPQNVMSSRSTILEFRTDGSFNRALTLPAPVSHMLYLNDTLYVLSDNQLYTMTGGQLYRLTVPDGCEKILAANDGTLLLATSSSVLSLQPASLPAEQYKIDFSTANDTVPVLYEGEIPENEILSEDVLPIDTVAETDPEETDSDGAETMPESDEG